LDIHVKSEQVDGDAGPEQWTEEEWREWENWDGYEEVKEEIDDEEEEEHEEVEPQEEPEEEMKEPAVKRAKSTPKGGKGNDGYGKGSHDAYGKDKDSHEGYVDKSWDTSPWQWSEGSWSGGWGWGWNTYGKKWGHDDWVGARSSGSRQSPRQKAPWAYGPKGKSKGKGKKGKQDKHGGVYVRGGYVAPDQTFYK